MAKQKPNLNDYDADELLAELRARELGLPSDKRKGRKQRALAALDDTQLTKALRDAQKVVYGVDDRREAHEIDDPSAQRNADSVASLIDIGNITDNGDGTSTIETVKFGDANNLCSNERFRDQPTSPFCSGFLVSPDLLATAGHCINGNNLARTRFVFGFKMKPDGTANVVIPNEQIFLGVGIVAHELDQSGADFAVVKLERVVQGRVPLSMRRTGKVSDQSGLYVIGHPSGLPLKYAAGAVVRENASDDYFVANLDTYGGNSGSPVFNAASDEVEGILVRGETDFVLANGCRVSNVCPTTGCRGEDVTRTTLFSQHVPESGEIEDLNEALTERIDRLEESITEIGAAVKRIEDTL